MKSIQEILDKNIAMTRARFEETGEVTPLCIVHTEKGTIPIMFVPTGEDQKRILLTVVQLLMLKHRAYAYSIAFEAWVKECEGPGRDFEGEVRNQPDKTEALIIAYCGYDTTKMVTVAIQRNPTKLGEPKNFEGKMSGRFFELLPPQQIHGNAMTEDQTNALEFLLKLAETFGVKVQEITKDGEL